MKCAIDLKRLSSVVIIILLFKLFAVLLFTLCLLLWICHVITLQITTQGPRECLDNLLGLLSVDLCIGRGKASDKRKLVGELCDAIKDERCSVIGGSDDAPHKPTSLPDQGGHRPNDALCYRYCRPGQLAGEVDACPDCRANCILQLLQENMSKMNMHLAFC